MKDLKDIEDFRVKDGPLATTQEESAEHGMFVLPLKKNVLAVCVVTSGRHGDIDTGWEHVSMHIRYKTHSRKKTKEKSRLPRHEEMMCVRSLIWEKDEPVIQVLSNDGDGFAYNAHLWCASGKLASIPPGDTYTAGLNLIRAIAEINVEEEDDGKVAE